MNKVLKIVISLIITCLLIAVLLYLAVFGYFSYWTAYAKCGKQPVMLREGLSGPVEYIPPSNPSYSSIDPSLTASGYVCTEQEAIDAGYKPMYKPNGSLNYN